MNQVKLLPEHERPRERLRRLGAAALSLDELLAVLLGSGSKKDPVLKLSKDLLTRFQSVQGLAEASIEELQSFSGIGLAKALKLKAAFALATRYLDPHLQTNPPILSASDVYKIATPYFREEKRELFLLLMLNAKSQMIACEIISIGTLTATLVHPREVFYPAIKRKACSIIVAHNHPSGELKPSKEDLEVTIQLLNASKMIDIPLLDHLIIGGSRYFSMREQAIIFKS